MEIWSMFGLSIFFFRGLLIPERLRKAIKTTLTAQDIPLIWKQNFEHKINEKGKS